MTRRILIVDDDHEMVRTLRDIFHLRGWDTGEAYSGEEAIDAQQTQGFDRVIMDIKMPGIGGLAARQALHRQFPQLPIILMTAQRPADLDAGDAPVIAKPIDLPALFTMLDS
ncbi:MAG TPA: response regulator [Vicinamibacterales bacterium]|nr:response regulator [Vicinamibacterales bacterium]